MFVEVEELCQPELNSTLELSVELAVVADEKPFERSASDFQVQFPGSQRPWQAELPDCKQLAVEDSVVAKITLLDDV